MDPGDPLPLHVDTPVDLPVDLPVDVAVDLAVDVAVELPVDVAVDLPVDVAIELPVDSQEYRPELIPRRGELVAWIMTMMAFTAWLAINQLGLPVSLGLKFLAVFLGLAALAISLGNWMDRRTRLSLNSEGLSFDNGLRKAHMRWAEIERVEVLPSKWGGKVRVLAGMPHFDFRTLGEVRMHEQVKGRIGFEKGDQILREIILRAHLKQVRASEDGVYYYARE